MAVWGVKLAIFRERALLLRGDSADIFPHRGRSPFRGRFGDRGGGFRPAALRKPGSGEAMSALRMPGRRYRARSTCIGVIGPAGASRLHTRQLRAAPLRKGTVRIVSSAERPRRAT